MKKTLTILLTILLIASVFAGCGNGNTFSKYELEGTMSEVLPSDERRIWYITPHTSKSSYPYYALVCENGLATAYEIKTSSIITVDLTLGQIAQLSDDEIIDILKKESENYYNAYTAKNTVLNIVEREEYKNPTPGAMTFHISTDSSGNATYEERIKFECLHMDTEKIDNKRDRLILREGYESWDFYNVCYEITTIYDSHFAGFGNINNNLYLVTKVETDSMEDINISLDQPGNENVLVD